jgi:hypothetical protein
MDEQELPKRTDLLETLRSWQRQDLEQANAWLAENRTLFRNATLYNQEDARREVGRRLIRAMSERN